MLNLSIRLNLIGFDQFGVNFKYNTYNKINNYKIFKVRYIDLFYMINIFSLF